MKLLINQKYGKLIILEKLKNKILYYEKHKRTQVVGQYLCVCDCGKKIIRENRYFRSIKPPTCGSRSCKCAHNRLEFGQSSFNSLFSSYKQRAKLKNLDFYLSKEQFKYLTQQNCFYCNKIPKSVTTRKNQKPYGDYIYNGIDRKDSSKGYIIENCLPCCSDCNYAKQETSYDEFLNHILSIYNNLRNKDAIGARGFD